MSSSALDTTNNNNDGATAAAYSYMPTTTQQRVISSIQIPVSMLSLIGSSLIVYNIIRKNSSNSSKNSPHGRIMLALSVSSIISTLGWMLQPFLVPRTDVPDPWVYAVGNDASCVMLGAISQFSVISQPLYLAFLSLYFLLTVKFGVKQRDFEAKYERWIHASIVLIAVSTAMGGIALGLFRPNVISPGCWVNHDPQDEGCNGRWCREKTFALVFGAIPSLASLLVIFGSNLMVYVHVRTTVIEGQKKSMTSEMKLTDFQASLMSSSPAPLPPESTSRTFSDTQQQQVDECNVGTREEAVDARKKYTHSNASFSDISVLSGGDGKRSVLRSSNKQWKRVRKVGRQAFLYVGAYLLAFSWSFALHCCLIVLDFEHRQGSEDVTFPLVVLEAIFGGSLGFSLALIFFLPKIRQARRKYDCEPWWWVLQQVITGEAEKVERFSSISMASTIQGRRLSTSSRQRGDMPNKTKNSLTRGQASKVPPQQQVPVSISMSPILNRSESLSIDDMIEADMDTADTEELEHQEHITETHKNQNHESSSTSSSKSDEELGE
ncbi:unnamed protein product [Cylindrotheca closterium]|uniref:G-protein coupled receptors family 2 profile 2 domain-containing protein n=1 Tax=Cylindrotheca closterium TaxID=2856 RepID=A0AAD2CVA4_9STRA|nr:unnamed protein product [Cylindrotheca closterium]